VCGHTVRTNFALQFPAVEEDFGSSGSTKDTLSDVSVLVDSRHVLLCTKGRNY
jgi:hypothetical protein